MVVAHRQVIILLVANGESLGFRG